MMKKKYAFFDYDGTLAPGDSIVAFLKFARRRGVLPLHELCLTIGSTLLWKIGLRKDIPAKNTALRFLRRLPEEELNRLCRDFFEQGMKPLIHPQGLLEMQRLHGEGYTILLVTASPSVYMRYASPFLPVDELLATEYEPSSRRLIGENCKGEEKPRRIKALLAGRGEEIDFEHSHAYGDSLSDAPMLRLCAHRHCVNAKPALRDCFREDARASFEEWQKA